MSLLLSFFVFAHFLLFSLVGNSCAQQNATSCTHYIQCRYGEVCCDKVCAAACVDSYCRLSSQCGQNKCCFYRCKKSCDGSRCNRDRDCAGLKCCDGTCRDSCLGSVCDTRFRPRRTCGYHGTKRSRAMLQCCNGKCGLSCHGRQCMENRDCGGYGTRMKCCDGACKLSCEGSQCMVRRDCQGNRLECCGFFGSKVCQRTCFKSKCSDNADCSDAGIVLKCCGDGTCRRDCLGSVCESENFVSDCAGPTKTRFCCGIGQKKCRYDCRGVPCKTNGDCGPAMFYCGPPDSKNVSTCTENSHGAVYVIPLQ